MAENRIEQIRAELLTYFREEAWLPDLDEVYWSPDGKYFFRAQYYTQQVPTHAYVVTKIGLFEAPDKKLFEFIRNDDGIPHGWLRQGDDHYLWLSEDLEGKSIYDLTRQQFHSYSFEDDTFIWTGYYPSPDEKKLAVIGCHWACPDEIRVYDVSKVTEYPYPELYRQDSFQDTLRWLNDGTLEVKDSEGVVTVVSID